MSEPVAKRLDITELVAIAGWTTGEWVASKHTADMVRRDFYRLLSHIAALDSDIAAQAEELERLRGEHEHDVRFLAGSSLCEECQKYRERRRILATPRIQVEERADAAEAELATAREDTALLNHLETEIADPLCTPDDQAMLVITFGWVTTLREAVREHMSATRTQEASDEG